MSKICFGVDIGGTSAKVGLFNAAGVLDEKRAVGTDTSDNGAKILPAIADLILEMMAERGMTQEDVFGIGVGIPGPVIDGKVPVAVNLGWKDVDVVGILNARTGLPVFAGNDADVAALGEMKRGSAGGYRNELFLTLGTGVGGGVIINGEIITGTHHSIEPGHIHVSDEINEPCNCGNYGCLEQFCSATGIRRLAIEELDAHPEEETVLDRASVTAKDVFDACREGDALSTRVVEKFAHVFGAAVAGMAALIDPEIIVIGGGVSNAGETLLAPVKRRYQETAFSSMKETPICLASLGNDAGMYGAAALVLKDFWG